MLRAESCRGWTGIRTLDYAGQDLRLRKLPTKASNEETIVANLVDLRAHFHGWLHQDEFGPCRKDQSAALRALIGSLKRLQRQLIKAPPALKAGLDQMLRDCAGPSATIMQVFYEASADIEGILRTKRARHSQVERASRLKHCIATLEAQLQSLDTNTDCNIFDIAVIRGFDRSQAAGDMGLAEVEHWLNGYRDVLVATLKELNSRRGAGRRDVRRTRLGLRGGGDPLGSSRHG